jgi:hypothetical protein
MSPYALIATVALSAVPLIGCAGRSSTPPQSTTLLSGDQTATPPTPERVASLEDKRLLYRYIGRSFDHLHHTDELTATDEGARALMVDPSITARGHRCATGVPGASTDLPPGALIDLIALQHLSRLARERQLTDTSWLRASTSTYRELQHLYRLKTQFNLTSGVRCSAQLKAFTSQLSPLMESPVLEMMRSPPTSLAEVSSELFYLTQSRDQDSYTLFLMMIYEREETYSGERLEEQILCRSTAGPISLERVIYVTPPRAGGPATLGACERTPTPISPEGPH